jgi:DNA polymerase V
MGKMKRLFALVDCNNFYVSCERIFRPDLRNKPVIVLSNNDGCIIARSNEAKKLGIKMADPIFKHKNIITKEKVNVFSSNYSLYGDISNRIMQLITDYYFEVEIYSIDEAFISFKGLTETEVKYHMKKLGALIWQYLNVPVTVGIGATKTLAKLANYIAKTQYCTDLYYLSKNDRLLIDTPIKEIWGVSKGWQQKLEKLAIYTVKDFQMANQKAIRKATNVMGEKIHLELNEEVCHDLAEHQPKQSIVSSRSFGHPVTSIDDLNEALANYIMRATDKLRKQNSLTKLIAISLKTNYFNKHVKQYNNFATSQLSYPTQDPREILKVAKKLLRKIFVQGYQYKKVGIILLDIVPYHAIQNQLFHDNNQEIKQINDSKKLLSAFDTVKNKFGNNSVYLAAQGVERKWQMKSNNRSPSYTTDWNQLLEVK